MKQILSKLHAIMVEVDYIQKDKRNTHQNYSYASEAAIKQKLHELFVKNKVLFSINTGNPRVENGITWIDVDYFFTDVESGEEISRKFTGSGQARDEKGLYSAITGAIKYILTSTFLIPTGDDPEKDEEKQPAKSAAKAPVAPQAANVAPATPKQKEMIRQLYLEVEGKEATDAQLKKLNFKQAMSIEAKLLDKKASLAKIRAAEEAAADEPEPAPEYDEAPNEAPSAH
jgi:hypothetical protein